MLSSCDQEDQLTIVRILDGYRIELIERSGE